jgi:hypothetical protein
MMVAAVSVFGPARPGSVASAHADDQASDLTTLRGEPPVMRITITDGGIWTYPVATARHYNVIVDNLTERSAQLVFARVPDDSTPDEVQRDIQEQVVEAEYFDLGGAQAIVTVDIAGQAAAAPRTIGHGMVDLTSGLWIVTRFGAEPGTPVAIIRVNS